MSKYLRKNFEKIKAETGSVTVFVLVAVIFFAVVLVGVYTNNANKLSAQEKEIQKIQEQYDLKDAEIQQKYTEKLEELNQDIIITYTGTTSGTNYKTTDWCSEDLKATITFAGEMDKATVIVTDSSGHDTSYTQQQFEDNVHNIISKNCVITVITSNSTVTNSKKVSKVTRMDKIKPTVAFSDYVGSYFLIRKGTTKEIVLKVTATDNEATKDYGSSKVKIVKYGWTTDSNVDPAIWSEESNPTEPITASKTVGNGTYYLITEATDNAGNVLERAISDPIQIEEDYTSPSSPIITNSSNGEWTNQNVTIVLESTDNLEVDHYEVKKDDGTWETVGTLVNKKATITYTEEMDKTFTYRCIDTSGNISAESTARVRIDKTDPSTLVTPLDTTVVKTTELTINTQDSGGSGLDSTNSYQYQLSTSNTSVPTGTWSTYTSGEPNTIGTGLTGTYYLLGKRDKRYSWK